MIEFRQFCEEFTPTPEAVRRMGDWLVSRVETRLGISMSGITFKAVSEITDKKFLSALKWFFGPGGQRAKGRPSNFPAEKIGPAFTMMDDNTVYVNTGYGGFRDIGFLKFTIAHEIGHHIFEYYQEHGKLPEKFSYVQTVMGREISHSKSMWPNVGSWNYKDRTENLADAFGRYIAGEKLNEKERLAMEKITGRSIREAAGEV